jgi:hypothetical protein
MKVLLYTKTSTSRLQYICHFIFKELLNTDFTFSTDVEEFKNFESIKINYSNAIICEKEVHILPVELLFKQHISDQKIECFEVNNNKAFFKTSINGFPFDIFAASFYLLSRYEEYLPHQKDIYGRYAHENSLAFKERFLNIPLINIWVKDLTLAIREIFPDFTIHHSPFAFTPTYDIDIAYSYKHKGLIRNIGGFLKAPSIERIRVLLGLNKDSFDVYDWLNALHEKYQLTPIYFFLVAAKNSVYDKNISPGTKGMQQLISSIAKNNIIGIHPSWQSGDETVLFKKEKQQLETISEKIITISRQHYIRFNLPEGYRRLSEAGITDEYSMGYGSINGFRASVATPFYWFNLAENITTPLLIHPFCYMEANSFFEQHYTAETAAKELQYYHDITKATGGTLITIFHNHFLTEQKEWQDWREMYRLFILNNFPRVKKYH